MKFLLSTILILSSVFTLQAENRSKRLDHIVLSLMKQGEVSGLSIAVIDGGKLSFHSCYGVKNMKTGAKVDENTIFEAASLSKPVFAYAVLKLVENGKLDLDAPLTRYLNEPYIKGDNRLNLITARRVLSHSTGFPNWRPEGQPLKIFFIPGSRFSYSGEGYVYLQKAIEHITGKSLNTFMSESVFRPLEMTNSSYVWRRDYENRKADGYDSAGNPGSMRKPQEANAASSLHTTAIDYAKLVIAILQGTGLKQATIGEMLKPQIQVSEGCKECVDAPSDAKLSKLIYWGLGWGLQRTDRGISFWHWGDNNGEFHAYVSASVPQKRGVIILTNSGNGLSIIPELVSQISGEDQPAFAWIGIEPYNSPLKKLYRDILARGERVIRESDTKQFQEAQINRLGYWLLAKKKINEAIDVFRLNVENFPESWNAYDSLAEAYMLTGNRILAIQYYQKSLDLNPGNVNAAEKLRILRESQSQ